MKQPHTLRRAFIGNALFSLLSTITTLGTPQDITLQELRIESFYPMDPESADGNGRQQAIIDERADHSQREAIRKILHGESTTPAATHFFVYNSTMSEVLDPLYAPIELSIDVEVRKARLSVPDLVESTGSPIIDPNSGKEFRARIDLPGGFEYNVAEMGTASSTTRAAIALTFENSYGQFNHMHMNQDGVIR
jgi:hypothetical protein